MGRFAENYTEHQRESVTRAVLDDGHSGAEAQRMAARGAFGEAFEVPLSTVHYWAREERARRKGADKPRGLSEQARAVKRMTDQAIALEERKAPEDRDPDVLLKLWKLVKEARDQAGDATPAQTVDRAESPQPSGDLLTRLAQARGA